MGLAGKTLENTTIVFSATILEKVVGYASKLILARLLLPEYFGLIAVSDLVLNWARLFREGGIESALVYQKKDVELAADTAFVILFLIALSLYAVTFIAAPYIASFFNADIVSSVIRVTTLGLILSSFASVPMILLSKVLNFRKKIIPGVISTIANAGVAIPLALKGYGIWSLVYGDIISGVVGLIVIYFVSEWRPRFRFSWSIAKALVGYGGYVWGQTLLIFLTVNIDDAIVGKVFGMAALGIYTFAYGISNVPATYIVHIINDVLFPTYSLIEDNKERLKKAYLRVLKYISLATIPTSLGIFLTAPYFVPVLLGAKWLPAIPFIRVFSLYGLIRSFNASMGALLNATGHPKFLRDLALVQLIVLLLFIYPAIKYGVFGVAILVTIVQGVGFYLVSWKTCKIIRIGRWRMYTTVERNMFSSLISFLICVILIRFIIPEVSVYSTAVLFIVFGLIYVSLVLILDKEIKDDLFFLYRMAVKRFQ